MFDGNNIHLYTPVDVSRKPIVRQHYQPDRRIRARHTVVTNQLRVRQIGYIPTDLPDLYRIQGQHLLGTKQNKCMLVLKDDGNLYHYQQENQKFLQLNISSMDFNKVLSMTIDSNNLLWIFATGNNTRCYRLNHTGKKRDTDSGKAIWTSRLEACLHRRRFSLLH